MSTPKVSVIVPVFNVKTYLRECLDSILAQTLTDIEVICGDGGSTDGSLEIIQEYAQKDSRINYITKERSGYGQSMNDCMAMARGEYIGIVESDDAIEPDTYEVLYDLAKKNDLDWIRGDIYYYYSGMPEGKQLKRESIIYGGEFYNTVLNPQTDYRPYKSGLRTWSGIYKTAFLREHDIQHNETPGGSYQDVGFYLKTLYYANRVYFVNKAFYKWRQDNPGSSVHYDSAKLVEKSLKEWHLNREYLDKHPLIGNRALASYNYRKFFSYLWTIDMADADDKQKVQKLAAKEFSEALARGEIDKGFFECWEWNRFLEELKKWKMLLESPEVNAEDTGDILGAKEQAVEKGSLFKRAIKRFLRPFARVARKITNKLMSDVVFKFENELSSLLLRVNETAGDTQWQVRECTTELRQAIQEASGVKQQLQEQLEKNTCLIESLKPGIERLSEEIAVEADTIRTLVIRSEKLFDALTVIGQRIERNGEVLQEYSLHEGDTYDMISTIKQAIIDQGDILWKVKSRDEDIYDAVATIRQKVLDQGDVLWSTRDKVKDVELFAHQSADSLMWNFLFELKREKIENTIGSSPLYDSAFYLNNRYGSIVSAQHILGTLFKELPHQSVIDFGCGTGTWLWVAKALGAEEIFGIDGDYVPRALLLIPEENFMPADLENKIVLDRRYDLAMSLEVGEHLSESAADTYIDTLCDSADTILFSAAHPGQGGDCHINEQPREYWIEKFMARGFKLHEVRNRFQNDMKILPWYRENLMLFER